MKVNQYHCRARNWVPTLPSEPDPDVHWLLYTGEPGLLAGGPDLESLFPNAHLIGCSTAGEILDTGVHEGTGCLHAIHFEHTPLAFTATHLSGPDDSAAAGARIGRQLPPEGLSQVLVLSEGLNVNGTALVNGLKEVLPAQVAVSGGLAGDYGHFTQTRVWLDRPLGNHQVVAVGFYGDRLQLGYGSAGGWDTFGPEREITRSEGNRLFELDGRSALGLYKEYLGDYAADLPASALLFPLAVTRQDGSTVVRTILGVEEPEQSMMFAGDVPEGARARFMKANVDRLVDGAEQAARQALQALPDPPDFALLVSCVGRKMVMGQRVEEEIEVIREVLGDATPLAGFYSYGEVSPLPGEQGASGLHNQTMTITCFRERPEPGGRHA